jgi:hypothetical protein
MEKGRPLGSPPLVCRSLPPEAAFSYLPLKSKFAVTVWFGPTVMS